MRPEMKITQNEIFFAMRKILFTLVFIAGKMK